MSLGPTLVAGRNCDGCALCCKLMDIPVLDKPENVWCRFCVDHQGCGNYADRPVDCRTYYCEYRKQDWIGEEWKPSQSRMIVALLDQGRQLVVKVDPQRPDAWRRAPYYATIKQWAATAAARGDKVVVVIHRRFFVIYPDRDLDMGTVGDDECILFGKTGEQLDARVIKKADEHLYR